MKENKDSGTIDEYDAQPRPVKIALTEHFYFADDVPMLSFAMGCMTDQPREDIYQAVRLKDPQMIQGVLHSEAVQFFSAYRGPENWRDFISDDVTEFPRGTLILKKVFDGESQMPVSNENQEYFALLPGAQQKQQNPLRIQATFDEQGRVKGYNRLSSVAHTHYLDVLGPVIEGWSDRCQSNAHMCDILDIGSG